MTFIRVLPSLYTYLMVSLKSNDGTARLFGFAFLAIMVKIPFYFYRLKSTVLFYRFKSFHFTGRLKSTAWFNHPVRKVDRAVNHPGLPVVDLLSVL